MKSLLLAFLLFGGQLHAQKPVQRHPLGWRSAPDHAKGLKQLAFHPAFRAAPLPAAASVEDNLPPVYDQGNIGSCVAQGAAAPFDRNWKIRTGHFVTPSRLDIYQNCLRHDGNFPRDYGTYVSTAMWVLKNKGVLKESTWPYVIENLSAHAPTAWRNERARQAAITTYDVSNTDNGYSVKQAIANAKLPVIVGGYVYTQIFNVKASDPFIAMPTGRKEGGHCMVAVAYDDNLQHDGQRGFVKLRNSWGEEWGAHGMAYIPYAYIFNPKMFEDFAAVETTGKRVVKSKTSPAPTRALRWPWQRN